MAEQSAALVVDGRVDVAAVAEFAGELRAQVEQMQAQLDAAGAALSSVTVDAAEDGEVPAVVKSGVLRLAAAVADARRALSVVPPVAADVAREAL